MLGNTKPSRENGYTVVELITVIVVLGIILIPLSVITINFMGAMIARNTEAQLAAESQILLRSITEELRTASSVRPNATIADPNAPPGGWTTANASLILVISTPVLDNSPDRNFVPDPLTNLPMQNEIVYFAKDKDLYRRRLANPAAPVNNISTTCPVASPTCPADTKLTSNFDHMDFVLYNQDDAVTTDISQARSILMTVNMIKPTFGRDAKFINQMRMTIRNTL